MIVKQNPSARGETLMNGWSGTPQIPQKNTLTTLLNCPPELVSKTLLIKTPH